MKNRIVSVYAVIGIWIALFVIGRFTNVEMVLCGKGANMISDEYYRLFTASFLHVGLIHLIANCLGLYFATIYLDGLINGWIMMVIAIIAGTVANGIFSVITPQADSFMGGSVLVYSIIGLIVSMQILRKNTAPFKLGTWYGNWTLGYIILSNLFNGSLKVGDLSVLKIHVIAFAIGMVSAIFLKPCKLRK